MLYLPFGLVYEQKNRQFDFFHQTTTTNQQTSFLNFLSLVKILTISDLVVKSTNLSDNRGFFVEKLLILF